MACEVETNRVLRNLEEDNDGFIILLSHFDSWWLIRRIEEGLWQEWPRNQRPGMMQNNDGYAEAIERTYRGRAFWFDTEEAALAEAERRGLR